MVLTALNCLILDFNQGVFQEKARSVCAAFSSCVLGPLPKALCRCWRWRRRWRHNCVHISVYIFSSFSLLLSWHSIGVRVALLIMLCVSSPRPPPPPPPSAHRPQPPHLLPLRAQLSLSRTVRSGPSMCVSGSVYWCLCTCIRALGIFVCLLFRGDFSRRAPWRLRGKYICLCLLMPSPPLASACECLVLGPCANGPTAATAAIEKSSLRGLKYTHSFFLIVMCCGTVEQIRQMAGKKDYG